MEEEDLRQLLLAFHSENWTQFWNRKVIALVLIPSMHNWHEISLVSLNPFLNREHERDTPVRLHVFSFDLWHEVDNTALLPVKECREGSLTPLRSFLHDRSCQSECQWLLVDFIFTNRHGYTISIIAAHKGDISLWLVETIRLAAFRVIIVNEHGTLIKVVSVLHGKFNNFLGVATSHKVGCWPKVDDFIPNLASWLVNLITFNLCDKVSCELANNMAEEFIVFCFWFKMFLEANHALPSSTCNHLVGSSTLTGVQVRVLLEINFEPTYVSVGPLTRRDLCF